MAVKDSRPTHAVVTDVLRQELTAGRYPDGEPLPPEPVLCERFGVSRFTIRQALERLVVEGYITRQSGRGTFPVRRDHSAPWVRVVGDLERVMSIGDGTRFEPINLLRRESSAELSGLLALDSLEVWVVRGVRLLGERRIGHWQIALPPETAREIGEGFAPDLEHPNVIRVLTAKLGVRVGRAEQTTYAGECPVDIAEHLDVRPGTPVLIIDRLYFDGSDRPIEIARTHHRPDEYQHRLDLLPT